MVISTGAQHSFKPGFVKKSYSNVIAARDFVTWYNGDIENQVKVAESLLKGKKKVVIVG